MSRSTGGVLYLTDPVRQESGVLSDSDYDDALGKLDIAQCESPHTHKIRPRLPHLTTRTLNRLGVSALKDTLQHSLSKHVQKIMTKG